MKFPILLCIILLYTLQGYAQKLRFTDTTNQWHIMLHAGEPWTDHPYNAFYGADTILGGNTYRILFDNSTTAYIREDTTTNMVYARYGTDTADGVLYNYNLHVGDTVRNTFGAYTFKDSVISLDSTLINGVYHKVFNMARDYTRYTYTEGIGCLTSPLFPVYGICFESESHLLCFSNSTGYPAATFSFAACFSTTRLFTNSNFCTDKVADISAPELTIAPNPASNYVVITGLQLGDNCSIYDITGRCKEQHTNTGKEQTINTATWPRGMYIVMVNGSHPTTSKLILQ